ncbi:winged helix-turn-helix domain-containing protein [Streptomyces sp. NPDC015414]|uniref:winged helix-turn-helix domain-containing protein n=1 Tax=Streptomyces sp. NPDC015414 TaxID=3364957 RepID=UPI0036F5DF08
MAEGPVAHGRPDQTWTLARIKTLTGRRFRKSMTLPSIARMLHQKLFSHQFPARRAIERDQEAVVGYVKERLGYLIWRRGAGPRPAEHPGRLLLSPRRRRSGPPSDAHAAPRNNPTASYARSGASLLLTWGASPCCLW